MRRASAEVDTFRKKIVATKEGGAITGEERLREFLADLYGNVVGFEGRPSQTQVERADALARELADVVKSLRASAASASQLASTSSGYRAGLLGSIAAACTASYTVALVFGAPAS